MNIVFFVALPLILWLSYYISASVYKSLKRNDNKYARLIQVLIALGVLLVLAVILVVFILSQVRLTR